MVEKHYFFVFQCHLIVMVKGNNMLMLTHISVIIKQHVDVVMRLFTFSKFNNFINVIFKMKTHSTFGGQCWTIGFARKESEPDDGTGFVHVNVQADLAHAILRNL